VKTPNEWTIKAIRSPPGIGNGFNKKRARQPFKLDLSVALIIEKITAWSRDKDCNYEVFGIQFKNQFL
jgi:hypothetical protein